MPSSHVLYPMGMCLYPTRHSSAATGQHQMAEQRSQMAEQQKWCNESPECAVLTHRANNSGREAPSHVNDSVQNTKRGHLVTHVVAVAATPRQPTDNLLDQGGRR